LEGLILGFRLLTCAVDKTLVLDTRSGG